MTGKNEVRAVLDKKTRLGHTFLEYNIRLVGS